MKSAEKLINDFKLISRETVNVNYGDKKSVKKYNKMMTELRKIANEFYENYPNKVVEFACLLQEKRDDIDFHCAFLLLQIMDPPIDIKEKSIKIIKEFINEDNINSYGGSVWLEQYLKNSK